DSFGFVSLRVLVLHSLLQDYNYDGKLKLIPPTADRQPPPVSTNPIRDSATHIAISETAHLLHHLQIYLGFFLRLQRRLLGTEFSEGQLLRFPFFLCFSHPLFLR
ncbi:hypothetical protein AABB24_033315, partial [Solanum stoloniferum]